MIDPTPVCRAEPGLVDHIRQLLGDAGVDSSIAADGARVRIDVARDDEERARAVIGLVLPQLLEPAPDAVHLSDRLVRTEDDEGLPGGLVDGRLTYGYADPLEPPAESDEEYVPPPPPPIRRPRDRFAWAAWLGVIVGPLLLLGVPLIGLPSYCTPLGLVLFIGGFATLIARMDDRRGRDPDDGAVV